VGDWPIANDTRAMLMASSEIKRFIVELLCGFIVN